MSEFVLDSCIEDELWGIWCFIARDNADAATRVVEAAYETFQTLAANPEMGRLRKFRNPRLRGIRSWCISGFENYVIFYRGTSNGIQVLHIYHGARDIEHLFGEA
jgi:toxin ParE1/3/4